MRLGLRACYAAIKQHRWDLGNLFLFVPDFQHAIHNRQFLDLTQNRKKSFRVFRRGAQTIIIQGLVCGRSGVKSLEVYHLIPPF
jgi:hypothetical protein